MAEVQTLVFPRPSRTNSLNDNYYVGSQTLHVRPVRRDPKCYKTQLLSKQTVKLDVYYPVVLHALSVLLPGLPQKKGVRPVPYQDKIKHVKGVCCVNPCLFVPSVPNVPSAVSEQNVGWGWGDYKAFGKFGKIRVSSQTGLQFCRLLVRPDHRSGSTHSRPMGNPSGETEVHERPLPVYASSIHVAFI